MKYYVGDWVQVKHPMYGFWEGEIYKISNPGDWGVEYWITNAPPIPWAPHIPVLVWAEWMVLAPRWSPP